MRSRSAYRPLAFVAGALLLGLGLAAGGTPAGVQAAATPDPVDVRTVQIVDADGLPVEGGVVELTPLTSDAPLYGVTRAGGELDLTAIDGIEVGGLYQMWIYAVGLADYWDRPRNPDDTVPVRLTSGDDTLVVPALGSNPQPDATSAGISGRVTDALTGQPLEGVQVLALDDSSGGSGEGTGAGGSGQDGTYYLNYSGDVLPGAAAVRFTSFFPTAAAPFGYEMQTFDGVNDSSGLPESPVDLRAGETTAGIDARLLPKGRLTGTVTEATEGGIVPLDDAQISLRSTESGVVVAGGSSGQDGRFAFAAPAGRWIIQFDKIQDGEVVATQFYAGAETFEAGDVVEVSPTLSTDGIDARFGTVPTPPVTPTPTPTSSATAVPVLPVTGSSDATPLVLGAAALTSVGLVALLVARRARRRA